MSVVVVTGGTGFLASWIVRRLLEGGHDVRATVRSEAKGEVLRRMLQAEGVDTTDLSTPVADLGSPLGWDEVMAGADHVMHTASPLGGDNPDDPELVTLARDGVEHVLRAAAQAGVRKVVMTSSRGAAFPRRKDPRTQVDESFWTDPDNPEITQYVKSKLVAERTAWEILDDRSGVALTTILPGAIFGPAMGGGSSSTKALFTAILEGSPSPKVLYTIVDVRDLAELHLLAMENPAADGQRFLAEAGDMSMPDMARLLREHLGERGDRISDRTVPTLLVRLMARRNPTMRVLGTMIGTHFRHTHDKATRLLGWHPRPVEETVVDSAEYVLAEG